MKWVVMMVNSMTGFGQASKKFEESTLTIEVKTVNHRFLDIAFKMPRDLMVFEDKMKKNIQKYIKRGRVDVYINIRGESLKDKNIQVNWNVLNQYVEKLEEIQREKQIEGKLTMDHILRFDDIFHIEEQSELDEQFEEVLMNTLDEVINKVSLMRIEEGKSLKEDLNNRIMNIESLTKKLEDCVDEIKEQYREKIIERIHEQLENVTIDESRIIQEAAILVEKGDITEEITRLLSHVEQFRETVKLGGSIGRKLDFLTQELLRESNTIGSKSNHLSISKHVVELKSEIEKIKEQVQNIE